MNWAARVSEGSDEGPGARNKCISKFPHESRCRSLVGRILFRMKEIVSFLCSVIMTAITVISFCVLALDINKWSMPLVAVLKKLIIGEYQRIHQTYYLSIDRQDLNFKLEGFKV